MLLWRSTRAAPDLRSGAGDHGRGAGVRVKSGFIFPILVAAHHLANIEGEGILRLRDERGRAARHVEMAWPENGLWHAALYQTPCCGACPDRAPPHYAMLQVAPAR